MKKKPSTYKQYTGGGKPVFQDITEPEFVAMVAHAYWNMPRKVCKSVLQSVEDKEITKAFRAESKRRK